VPSTGSTAPEIPDIPHNLLLVTLSAFRLPECLTANFGQKQSLAETIPNFRSPISKETFERIAAAQNDLLIRRLMTRMYGPTMRCKMDFGMNKRSCVNVFGLVLRAMMGISAHSLSLAERPVSANGLRSRARSVHPITAEEAALFTHHPKPIFRASDPVGQDQSGLANTRSDPRRSVRRTTSPGQ
jgi:hypothetical protein